MATTAMGEIEAGVTAEMISLDDYCAEAEKVLEQARREHARLRGQVGGLVGKVSEARGLLERTPEFNQDLARRLQEATEREKHARARLEIATTALTDATAGLREKKDEHRVEAGRREKLAITALVDELYGRLLAAKEISDKLLRLGQTGGAPRDLWFQSLVKSSSTGKSQLEMWRGFTQRRLRGEE